MKVTREEWSKLYDEHSAGVRAMLYQMGAGRDLDDVVQECWIKVWKGMASFRGDSSLKTWIHRIATHALYDHFRSKGVRLDQSAATEYDDEAKSTAVSGEETVKSFAAPDAFMTADVVSAALDALSPEHRSVLVLALIDEHSLEEIAEITGVPLGTIKSRLHHAKDKFKVVLKKKGVTYEFE